MRTLIVGDIHGCFDELLDLLDLARLGTEDLVVSVGDLVDRGPKSFEVVAYFREDTEHRRAVLGNHELKHLRLDGAEPGDPSCRITRRTLSEGRYAEMRAYLATLPLWLDLPEVLVVHAGLVPGLPLEEQPPNVLTGRGSQSRPGFDGRTPWWFDDEAFAFPKPVVFGHQRSAEVIRGARRQVWGLNTKAAEGGRLSGLLVPGFELISVPTPDYWRSAREQWLPRFLEEDLPTMPWKRVLELEAEAWPDSTARAVRMAQSSFDEAASRVRAEVTALCEQTGYARLDPAARAAVVHRLREELPGAGAWRHLVARCFPGGQERALLAKHLATPAALAEALSRAAGPAGRE